MKSNRVAITISVLVILLLAVFFAPLPISRIRQTGLVQIEPEAKDMVYVPLTSTLEALHVRDGQWVAKDSLLAELRNRDIELRLEQVRTELAIRLVQLRTLRNRLAEATSPDDKARLAISLAQTDGERQFYVRQVEINEKMLQRLMIRAPRAGVVFALPHREEIGKLWDRNTPVCGVGDPSRLRMLVPLQPDDYQLLQEELAANKALGVTLRVQGWAGQTWPGRVTMLSGTEAKSVPQALTSRSGGPLATNPHSNLSTDEFELQSQHYLVGIEVIHADREQIWPGTLGQAKVHCRWRPLSWWLWRKICFVFGGV